VNYNIPLDPAAFATLQNTMTEGALKSYMERAAAETQKQLQQTTTAATQEAQSASQDYLQAAQQPVPEPDALAQFVPSLLGNIASVISQNPSYREQAQKDIHEKRQDLRQKRADNLLALKDMWDTKARLAANAGDREAEINARLKVEQLSKIAEQMLDAQREAHGLALEDLKHKHELEQIGARGRQERLTQAEKPVVGAGLPPGQDESSYINIRETLDGQSTPYVDISQVKGQKLHDTLLAYGRINKLPVVDATGDQALKLIKDTKGNLDTITENIIPLLPAGGGLKRGTAAFDNWWKSTLQMPGKGAQLAAYPAYRTAAITTIQTLASLGKGLRINQAEIRAAQNFDYPTIYDSQETARAKFDILQTMMSHMEGAILGRPPSEAEVAKVLKALRELKSKGTIEAPKVIRYDKNGKRLN